MMKTLFAATMGLALACTAQAQDTDRAGLWLTTGFLSKHTSHRKEPRRGWNETNTGIGVEYAFDARWRLAAGTYENSVYRTSRYAQGVWTPDASRWQLGDARLTVGLAVGVVDGYPRMNGGNWAPTVLPVASAEIGRFGVNLSYIPSVVGNAAGAVAVQARLLLF